MLLFSIFIKLGMEIFKFVSYVSLPSKQEVGDIMCFFY